MITRFGSKVVPIKSTGDGWVDVRRESGEVKEFHISDLRIEGDESKAEEEVIRQVLSAAAI